MEQDSNSQPALRPIEISRIRPNPANPRGPNVGETDKNLIYLTESISEVGILVPLLVRRIDDEEYEYELIDGERRFEAAKTLALDKVPAHIVDEPLDPYAIQKRMFHIHHQREQWTAAQECYALEPFYKELVSEFGAEDHDRLRRELMERTGLKERTATDRLQFLRWPADIKKAVYEGDGLEDAAPYWFVVELEAKIVEPAQQNFPEYFDKVPADDVRALLFRKWQENVVAAAENVRDAGIIARFKPPDDKRGQALSILADLVEDETLGFDEARQRYLEVIPEAAEKSLYGPRKLHGAIQTLTAQLADYPPEYILKGRRTSKVQLGAFLDALRELVRVAERLISGLGGE